LRELQFGRVSRQAPTSHASTWNAFDETSRCGIGTAAATFSYSAPRGRLMRLRLIPPFLIALRTSLAPLIVTLALYDPDRSAFGVCLVLAFLSDIFDGVIARRLGIATPTLRRLVPVRRNFRRSGRPGNVGGAFGLEVRRTIPRARIPMALKLAA
jgi:hypothetical protein